MSAGFQTIAALVIVALAAAYLVYAYFKKRRSPGCGDNCGAVSPEVKKLQAQLKRRP